MRVWEKLSYANVEIPTLFRKERERKMGQPVVEVLSHYFIFRFDEALGIVLRGDVAELDVVRQGTEQRNSFADENGVSIDDDPLNHTGAQKVLDRDSAIDIDMLEAAGSEFGANFCWISGHLFDSASPGHFFAHRGEIDRAGAEDDDPPVVIWPFGKSENSLKGVAPNDERIHGGYEFVVAVRVAIGGQEVVSAVAAGDETVEADTDKD
jgi:hypothetical protein